MIYIFGASGSGKSKFAEEEVLKLEKEIGFDIEKIYLATMKIYSLEDEEKVKKHKAQRKGKGFRTIEAYKNIGDIKINKKTIVLLECMANLVANNKFVGDASIEDNGLLLKKLWQDICKLDAKCTELVIVGNDIYNDSEEEKENFSKETLSYIELMHSLHLRLIKKAKKVKELVFGLEI